MLKDIPDSAQICMSSAKCMVGSEDVLVSKKRGVTSSVLVAAVSYIVETILLCCLSIPLQDRNTLLHLLCREGRTDCCRLQLKNGASVNSQDKVSEVVAEIRYCEISMTHDVTYYAYLLSLVPTCTRMGILH